MLETQSRALKTHILA